MKNGEARKKGGFGMVGCDRRSLLKGVGAGAGVLVAGGMMPHPAKSAPLPGLGGGGPLTERKLDPNGGLSVILLGTGTPLPNPDRACASTLVIAGDQTFLFDTGRGFLTRMAEAGLTTSHWSCSPIIIPIMSGNSGSSWSTARLPARTSPSR